MRKILYIAILTLTCFAPVEPLDIAELLPVEAVAVYTDRNDIVLETDTGNIGRGATVEEALADLKTETPAVIYLDTAEYLLVSEDTLLVLEDIAKLLKPKVKVSCCDAGGRVKDAAKYLHVHPQYKMLREIMSEKKEFWKIPKYSLDK